MTEPKYLDGDLASPDGAGAEAATPAASPELERRAFVRRMTNDTVGLAGRLFGASRMLTRASVAAGQAVRDNLEAMTTEGEPAAIAGESAPAEAVAAAPEPAVAALQPISTVATPAPVTPPRAAAPDPVPEQASATVRLTARQSELLAGVTSATIAVNGQNGAPVVGIVPVHWDGETVRFASLGWSRRAAAIRSDPRVSVLIEDAGSGEAIWLEGVARIVAGDGLRAAMEPFLPSDAEAAARDAAWTALLAEDYDRVVILVRPTTALPGRARR